MKPAHTKTPPTPLTDQKRNRSGAALQQTEKPTLSQVDADVVAGEQPKLDYISKPNHIWITHLTEDLVKDTGGRAADQHLYLTAYNGSVARTKVRVQGLSQYGELCFEHDVQINSGWTRMLVDPRGVHVDQNNNYRDPFPVTFVIASEVDVVLTGVFESVTFVTGGPDLGFQARHQLVFARIDCANSSYAIPCALPHHRPWSEELLSGS